MKKYNVKSPEGTIYIVATDFNPLFNANMSIEFRRNGQYCSNGFQSVVEMRVNQKSSVGTGNIVATYNLFVKLI